MRSDFEPLNLKASNAKLDEHILSLPPYQEYNDVDITKDQTTSLWKKFLGLFKTNPFELPEDLYKHK